MTDHKAWEALCGEPVRQLHNGEPVEGAVVWRAPCPGCQLIDGKPDAELLDEIGSCIFGCGRPIDRDTRMCRECGDHSANHAECEHCGREYEDWDGKWSYVVGTPR